MHEVHKAHGVQGVRPAGGPICILCCMSNGVMVPHLTLVIAVTFLLLAEGAAQEVRYDETVDVQRVIVDLRAFDQKGRALTDLSASDFRASIDGAPARVESVQWVGLGEAVSHDESGEPMAPGRPAASGRLVLLFFQLHQEPGRRRGLLGLMPRLHRLVDGLTADDRVAVASFDTHLKLWTDFTSDALAVKALIGRPLLFDRDPAWPEPADPQWSVGAALDGAAARRAATAEQALVLLGQALGGLPGTKVVVLIGHGFGEVGVFTVRMNPEYEHARRALVDARAMVFALDVNQADRHLLEGTLERVALDTGGLYLRTFRFPDASITTLGEALKGHYVLILEPPADLSARRPEPTVHVELVGRRGTVVVR